MTEKKQELSADQKQDLWDQYDKIVKAGADTFIEVGLALQEIATHKLYKPKFKNFADYVADRLNISYQQGYKLKNAALLADRFKKDTDVKVLPKNESQLRPLLKIKDNYAAQKKAWLAACEEGEAVTARTVKAQVQTVDSKAYEKELERAAMAQNLVDALEVAIEEGNLDEAKKLFAQIHG